MIEYASTTVRFCLLIFIMMSSSAEVLINHVYAAANPMASLPLSTHQSTVAHNSLNDDSDCHSSINEMQGYATTTKPARSALTSSKHANTSTPHHLPAQNSVAEHITDCCEPTNCECPEGYCQTVSNIPVLTVLTIPIITTQPSHHSANLLHSRITTPYRPPIL